MRRFITVLLQLVLLIGLAYWLSDRPGTAHITWHGYEIETSAALLGFGILVFAYVVFILFRFLHFVITAPARWRTGRRIKKLEDGQTLLTQGFAAIAAGDAPEAGTYALKARKKLGEGALTTLLQAQAAQLAGDSRAAVALFRELAAHKDSAVFGYRGLIMEARKREDWNEVAKLVERMEDAQPDTPWLNLVRFELATRDRDWLSANRALSAISDTSLLRDDKAKQHRAAILLAAAEDKIRLGQNSEALELAEQAVRASRGWLPAIITLTRCQMMAGQERAAFRTAEKYWQETPHPHIARALWSGSKSSLDTVKVMERLTRHAENAPESMLVLAEANLAASIWGEARRNLMALLQCGHATQGAYRLLSKLERMEKGDEKAALTWLTKAMDAAPDPSWLCHACGGQHTDWRANCGHCGSFNSLAWGASGQKQPAPTSLLPADRILEGL